MAPMLFRLYYSLGEDMFDEFNCIYMAPGHRFIFKLGRRQCTVYVDVLDMPRAGTPYTLTFEYLDMENNPLKREGLFPMILDGKISEFLSRL